MKKLMILMSVLLCSPQTLVAKPRLRGLSSPNRMYRSNRIPVVGGNSHRHTSRRHLRRSYRRLHLNRRCQTRSYAQPRYNRRPNRTYVQRYQIQYNTRRPRISRYNSGSYKILISAQRGRKTVIIRTYSTIPFRQISRINILSECRSKVRR